MPDAGEIKAKVSIEYDGSGVDAAKKDLASLADIVGGGLAESTGSATEALSSLDEQMGKSADSTTALVSSVGALEKPLQRGSDGITTVNEALGAQQAVIESAGAAFERLQKPIAGTTVLMEDASPPMLSIAQNAESMQKQMSGVNDGFVQIGESLSQSVPLLPQFASSLHSVSEEFDPRAFGLDNFNENMAVFQDAMANPYPFQMIQQHLTETGQTWDDFSSSIGDSNAAFLDQMAAMPVASEKAFNTISSGAEGVGQTFYAAAGQTEAFNKQWADLGASIDGINSSGGVGTALYGPAESWNKLDNALSSTEEGLGKLGAAGGEVAGGGSLWSGFIGGLQQVAMPLFAVQMIGMAVGAVSSGIYNMAALAEGPAAHSVGSFTGAIDMLGQHSQDAAKQFSESFGQGLTPTLDAMNNVAGKGGSGTDFWGTIGGAIGAGLGLVGNLGQIIAGGVVDLGSLGFTMNPSNPVGNSWLQTGWESLQNTWAGIMGQPEPYPTPGGGSSQQQIDLSTIQLQITQSIATMNAQANSPQYLAAQAYLQSQAGYAQLGQAYYDVSHSSGRSPFDYAPQAYQNAMSGYALANGGSGYGLSDVDLNKAYFSAMLNNLPPEYTPGCFPAGTRVTLSDGTEKTIEALHVGENVMAHDGTKQVATTILALIKPPPKRVYTLTFDNGNTLTLTDSHPISTAQGWKSLSPTSTKRENPDLAVMLLHVGDRIHTVSGTCTLLDIQPREIVQVYNITVGEPHTFYAGGVLVHNKALGSQVMQNVANTEVPQTDMKNTNLIQSMMSNFTGADLSHTFTASVTWVGQGLTNTFTGIASWVGQGLSNAFTGIASWVGQNLSNAFTGIASWVGQGLSNAFTGVASWIGQGLSNAFTGVASWIGQGLTNTFTGITDWVGQNLNHTFTAVANWIGQNLTPTFSLSTGSAPGFAGGVENFGGGLAWVGEQGKELLWLPPGSNVYPEQSVDAASLSPFSGLGGGSASSGDVHVHVHVGSKEIAHEIIPQIAPILRSQRGIRQ